jgi:PadR family transcriptional regulator, regulatory protein PadR
MARGSRLGDLEELVLLAVLRLGREAHGGRIREELRALARRRVSVSTIYVTLMRLEEKGYARSWKGEPTTSRGGKAKRHYEVTPAGVEVLQRVRDVRERMWRGVAEGEAHV